MIHQHHFATPDFLPAAPLLPRPPRPRPPLFPPFFGLPLSSGTLALLLLFCRRFLQVATGFSFPFSLLLLLLLLRYLDDFPSIVYQWIKGVSIANVVVCLRCFDSL